MKKKVFGRKLSRSRPAREALFSALIRGMILNGKMVTTRAKAKAVQGDLEHMVTLAKRGDLNSRMRAASYLDNARDAVDTLFRQIGPVFANRTSGFIRIINLPQRRGDNAKVVRVEWTEKVELKKEAVKDKKTKTDKKPSSAKATEGQVKKVVKTRAVKK